MKQLQRQGNLILDSFIDAISWDISIQKIIGWTKNNESRYICICNVHSVVTAKNDPGLQSAINEADMATPDGYPVAWLLRKTGYKDQQRINGPDLMWRLCEYSNNNALSMFLYGSTDETLQKLQQRLYEYFPNIQITGSYSPPFRTLTSDEENKTINLINSTGAQIVFVGLGCPKQEIWMATQRGKINATMIGVGAAFDYHAGTLQRAPLWMQNHGLEWLYRLIKEPRRLWKRYLTTNIKFLTFAILSILRKTHINKKK